MPKRYTVQFQLWDVTGGENRGDLLDESPVFNASPLAQINEHWAAWSADSPVPLDPISVRAVRVALTRNNGEAVTRRRFEFDGRRFLITIRTASAPEYFEAPGYFLKITGDRVALFVAGDGWRVMTPYAGGSPIKE